MFCQMCFCLVACIRFIFASLCTSFDTSMYTSWKSNNNNNHTPHTSKSMRVMRLKTNELCAVHMDCVDLVRLRCANDVDWMCCVAILRLHPSISVSATVAGGYVAIVVVFGAFIYTTIHKKSIIFRNLYTLNGIHNWHHCLESNTLLNRFVLSGLSVSIAILPLFCAIRSLLSLQYQQAAVQQLHSFARTPRV